jgi:hypothetical protein
VGHSRGTEGAQFGAQSARANSQGEQRNLSRWEQRQEQRERRARRVAAPPTVYIAPDTRTPGQQARGFHSYSQIAVVGNAIAGSQAIAQLAQ